MRAENSFIPVTGVGEKTERRLWRRGVTHWDDFDEAELGPTLSDRTAGFIEDARERLAADDARFFAESFPNGSHWRLYENFRDGACFLDIETTGLSARRDDVTVVGLYRDGEATTLVRGRDLTRDTLSAALADATLLVTFNGRRFDVPFLERAFGASVDLPHLDLASPCRRLDLTGGLKGIERDLGIERERPDLSGRDAVRLWHDYRRGDEAALETLVAYNRDDAVNLAAVADQVTRRLHERVFAAACDGTTTDA